MSKQTQEKVAEYQALEQTRQQLLQTKQTFSAQLLEVESALSELSSDAYKIIGSIMVKQSEEKLKADLHSRKEMIEMRMTRLDKQEKQMTERAEELQKTIMTEMENK